MSGFIASPASPALPAGAIVTGGDFWPDIDLNKFLEAMRVGGNSITGPRLIPAITDAIITVGDDLAEWRAAQVAAGYVSLAAVPADLVNGERKYVSLWRRAVYAYAAADLTETHRDLTATAEGARRAEEFMPNADDHRRNAIRAIRKIKGTAGIDVDLL